MTLKEILTSVAKEIGINSSDDLPDSYREKLTRYINDALIELSGELRPRRSETLTLVNGVLDVSMLQKFMVRVIALERDGVRLPFYYGCDLSKLRVPATIDGDIVVTYVYMPDRLERDNDVPDLPEWGHNALVNYAAGREYASGDAIHLSSARACFELYNATKRIMREGRRTGVEFND